jgi:hypothetical protein
MIVEQFLKDIQRLIDKGTINPSAEISVLGDVYVDDIIWSFDSDNLTIGVHESSYNQLILLTAEKY